MTISVQDEDEEALAIDRVLHGQSVIGKTAKTIEVDGLRFSEKDLTRIGTLERGSFGEIEVVSCNLDGMVYARKIIDKHFALRNRDQCFVQLERDILLQAHKTASVWAPHLLCAFQTSTELNLVMDFLEGGTLWDVLESSPLDGKISEEDLLWWVPQIICAIDWCHEQGYVHRDIKPHNFVLTRSSHVQLIDFGSAAPLLPPTEQGVRLLPKRHCLVPCGTCDYISPEILRAHEEALVALEMSDGQSYAERSSGDEPGYGVEVDWWSLGAMLYEMIYGVAPFFANDIKQTYAKIMNHQRYLRFNRNVVVSDSFQMLLEGLLVDAEHRLGRHGSEEIKRQVIFRDISWQVVLDRPKPQHLHLPEFNYDVPLTRHLLPQDSPDPVARPPPLNDSDSSLPFALSALRQLSSPSSLAVSSMQMTPASKFAPSVTGIANQTGSLFIGFTWGPALDAFNPKKGPPTPKKASFRTTLETMGTQPLHNHLIVPATPRGNTGKTFVTPVRGNPTATPFARPSTVRRSTAPRRIMSDREAMKELVNLVGMSARKRVIESGRKPRILSGMSIGERSTRRTSSGTVKELRFDMVSTVVPPDERIKQRRRVSSASLSYTNSMASVDASSRTSEPTWSRMPPQPNFTITGTSSGSGIDGEEAEDYFEGVEEEIETETETEIPASPTPGPRPGSAMSMMSKRSQTPTVTTSCGTFGTLPSSVSLNTGSGAVQRKSSGSYLTVPSVYPEPIPPVPTPIIPVVAPRSPHRGRAGGAGSQEEDSLSDGVFDRLDRRHTKLVEDISGIHERLGDLARQMG